MLHLSSLEKTYYDLLKLKRLISNNIDNRKLHSILLEQVSNDLDKIIKEFEGERK